MAAAVGRRKQAADPSRQLRIKVNVVKRLHKDLIRYREEVVADREKLQQMEKDPAKDEYDQRKQEEIIAETEAMVPDSQRRLRDALDELRSFTDEHAENEEVTGSAQWAEAQELLEEHGATDGAEARDEVDEDEM